MIRVMNKEILIRLTPLEPYFLGSDRTFHYGENDVRRIGKSDYFIKSVKIPSQTTLFGILRYLGMQNRTVDYVLGDSEQYIGSSSFRFMDNSQSFGMIKSISPLLLMQNSTGRKLLRTPLNHCAVSAFKSEAGNTCFYPFSKFAESRITNGNICEEQILPLEFNAKEWLTDSYVDMQNGEITDSAELFAEKESVGIDIKRRDEAFYKMQFIKLKEDYSFAFYAVVDDMFPGKEGYPFCYCASDVYLMQRETGNSMEELLEHCRFSIIQTKTMREYQTNYRKTGQKQRFEKSDKLFRVIKAGSVLYPKEGHLEAIKNMISNDHFETIGMNCILEGGNS